jgi:hypothetical protein
VAPFARPSESTGIFLVRAVQTLRFRRNCADRHGYEEGAYESMIRRGAMAYGPIRSGKLAPDDSTLLDHPGCRRSHPLRSVDDSALRYGQLWPSVLAAPSATLYSPTTLHGQPDRSTTFYHPTDRTLMPMGVPLIRCVSLRCFALSSVRGTGGAHSVEWTLLASRHGRGSGHAGVTCLRGTSSGGGLGTTSTWHWR